MVILPNITEKIKSLQSRLDPEYIVNGVNDPFLMIAYIKCLRSILEKCWAFGIAFAFDKSQQISEMISFVLISAKTAKKTTSAILYEIAKLALHFHEDDDLLASSFSILNTMMEQNE